MAIEAGEELPKKLTAISIRSRVKTVLDIVAAKFGMVIEAISDLYDVSFVNLTPLLFGGYVLKALVISLGIEKNKKKLNLNTSLKQT